MYNVMIVDDEPVIKKGLQSFINWESLECRIVYEASNGFEAIELLNTGSVDIVISDIKMPGMDGLELSKHIYQNHPHVKIIILTAFADFSYAQLAIKYNVVDFVIKTNPSEKIPEAINKAKELIIQQKQIDSRLKLMENKLNENATILCENFIKDIINGIVYSSHDIRTGLVKYDLRLNHYFFILFEISDFTEENEDNTYALAKITNSAKNFFSMAFKNYIHYTFIMKKNRIFTIITFDENDQTICLNSIQMTCKEIQSFASGFMKINLSIGISNMHNSIDEIPQAYDEALMASSANFYLENNITLFSSLSDENKIKNLRQVHKYSDDILTLIQSGNQNRLSDMVSELFHEYRNSKESINQIKVSYLLLCSLCFKLLADYNIESDAMNETDIYTKIQHSKSIKTLEQIVFNVILATYRLFTAGKKRYNSIVREVDHFIRENYVKNITLQSIADHVHLNSSYLSRLFKKETGLSIIDTLSKTRIEQAKKILRNSEVKIYEVAVLVGIDDPAYFTYVFKKHVGVSPTEYKNKPYAE